METPSNHAIRIAPEDGTTKRLGASSVNWYLLLFVVIITLFAVYWGFVQPTSRQLTKLRRYVTSLEKSIADLNGHRETTGVTTGLLEQLARQGRVTSNAAVALNEMRDLQQQIVHEAQQLRSARQALERLSELRSDVASQVSLIEATGRAINSINDLHHSVCQSAGQTEEALFAVEQLKNVRDSLVEGIQKMDAADPLLARVDALHYRLASSADRTRQARVVSESLLAMEEDILNRGSDVDSAQLVLNDLIDLRNQVEAQAANIDKADTTLDQLVRLQDKVLDQSDAVVDAIETLELTGQVQEQMQRANGTFMSIRRMLTDVLMMEPTVQHAMRSLQPLTELGNLRRMDLGELRQAANVISNRRHVTLAETRDARAPSEVVADAQVTSVKK